MDINSYINLAQTIGTWVIAFLLAYGMGFFGHQSED